MGLSRTVSEINGEFSRKSHFFPSPVYFALPLTLVLLFLRISRPWNHGQGSIDVIESGTARYTVYGFLLVFYSNFVPEIFDFKNYVTLKTGLGSVKVIENVTIRQSAYDFLLTFHSNHGSIMSCLFRDRWRFQSKIAKFPTPLYFGPPLNGSLWNWVSAPGVKN